MTAISDIMRKAGLRTVIHEPLPFGEADPGRMGEVLSRTEALKDPRHDAIGEIEPELLDHAADAPEAVDDPLAQQIFARGLSRLMRLVRRVRRLVGLDQRELTDEERRELAELAEAQALDKTLRAEADICRDMAVNCLNRLNLCYRFPKSKNDLFMGGIQSVAFDALVYEANAIYMHVNTRRLPRGVLISQIVAPETLTELSLAIGKKVTADYNPERGCYLVVERAQGVRGIPPHVRFQDMFDAIPPSADELTIPLGMGANSKRIYRSLRAWPHLLIAGATNTGKSNSMNLILATLIMRNHPSQLKLLLVDLKGGMEFTYYENLPHLLKVPKLAPGGIIYNRDDVPDILQWLINEGERRMERLKRDKAKSIDRYNAWRAAKNRIPRIILVIDELADVRLAPHIGRIVEDRLSNLAGRMRAVGIHVIVATQTPKKEVISTLIKTNLPAKLAFSCSSYTASELIIDTGAARGLAPQGRAIFQMGNETLQVQTPYTPDGVIKKIVQDALEGKQIYDIKGIHDVGPEDILIYALDQLDGKLDVRKLEEHFRPKGVSRQDIQTLVGSWDCTRVMCRDRVYIVLPPVSGGRSVPRQLREAAPDAECRARCGRSCAAAPIINAPPDEGDDFNSNDDGDDDTVNIPHEEDLVLEPQAPVIV